MKIGITFSAFDASCGHVKMLEDAKDNAII
jgi:hypothetical protein